MDTETSTPRSAPLETGSAPGCAYCGGPLPALAPAGRPRLTCSDRCRRLVDFERRKLQRREAWIVAWRDAEARQLYPREFVRRQVREIRQEMRAIRAARQPSDAGVTG